MKKTIAVLIPILIVAFVAAVYFKSNLSRTMATATFSVDEEREGLNELCVKAPFGYYVIHYSVVPRGSGDLVEGQRKPFALGGKGMGNDPAGLFGDDRASSSFFPDTGIIDEIPVEKHVRIASNLNPAATAEMPEDERVLSRCGIYIIVTKDRSTFQRLSSIVEDWNIDAEPSVAGDA